MAPPLDDCAPGKVAERAKLSFAASKTLGDLQVFDNSADDYFCKMTGLPRRVAYLAAAFRVNRILPGARV
jgi:hypothetical protein